MPRWTRGPSSLLALVSDAAFKCTSSGCTFSADQSGNLENHVRAKHTGERPFKCEKCKEHKGFADKSGLLNHKKRKHGYVPHHRPEYFANKAAAKRYKQSTTVPSRRNGTASMELYGDGATWTTSSAGPSVMDSMGDPLHSLPAQPTSIRTQFHGINGQLVSQIPELYPPTPPVPIVPVQTAHPILPNIWAPQPVRPYPDYDANPFLFPRGANPAATTSGNEPDAVQYNQLGRLQPPVVQPDPIVTRPSVAYLPCAPARVPAPLTHQFVGGVGIPTSTEMAAPQLQSTSLIGMSFQAPGITENLLPPMGWTPDLTMENFMYGVEVEDPRLFKPPVPMARSGCLPY
ncbi:hypothetical protein BC834DRAFT_973708 [Gloeopeniophorella convolvens]|nr:hypothetical protein BC834DRAFT_973708 [Gloeopeniophorella convolvens]